MAGEGRYWLKAMEIAPDGMEDSKVQNKGVFCTWCLLPFPPIPGGGGEDVDRGRGAWEAVGSFLRSRKFTGHLRAAAQTTLSPGGA